MTTQVVLIVVHSALLGACSAGRKAVLNSQKMIERGGVVGKADNSGLTALGFCGQDSQHIPQVDLLLIDPQGRKSGFDPSIADVTWQIPNAGYEPNFSLADSTGEGNDGPVYSRLEVGPPMPAGNYTLQVIGRDVGSYKLAVAGTDADAKRNFEHSAFGLTEKGRISVFKLTFSPVPGQASAISKVITFQTLEDDLRLAGQQNLIDNDGILNSLLKKLENAAADFGRGQRETAKNVLDALVQELEAQKGKHVKEPAASILTQDAKVLKGGL